MLMSSGFTLQGFTDAYYPMFVDEDNQVLPLDKVIRSGMKDAYGKPYAEIVTPTVVAEARKLFDCPTLTGVPLENEGGNGTASAHWEYR
jgi:leishmanolysin